MNNAYLNHNNTTGEIMNTTFINAQDLRADDKVLAQNEKSRFNDHCTDRCWLCHKAMSDKAYESAWHIHMTVDQTIVPNALSDSLPASSDQGFFPVGSECAKKIPLSHRTKMSN